MFTKEFLASGVNRTKPTIKFLLFRLLYVWVQINIIFIQTYLYRTASCMEWSKLFWTSLHLCTHPCIEQSSQTSTSFSCLDYVLIPLQGWPPIKGLKLDTSWLIFKAVRLLQISNSKYLRINTTTRHIEIENSNHWL